MTISRKEREGRRGFRWTSSIDTHMTSELPSQYSTVQFTSSFALTCAQSHKMSLMLQMLQFDASDMGSLREKYTADREQQVIFFRSVAE